MICTLCGRRSARRACPALGQNICTVCCGTKREVEIRCPSDCVHLAAGKAHPAAVVRRQQELDARVFYAAAQNLTDQQGEILLALLGFVREYRGDVLLRVADVDVESAAAALAATHEASAKGLIYEERPRSLAAQRLAADWQAYLAALAEHDHTSADRDLAVAFRAIERGVVEARKLLGGADDAYLSMLKRLIVPDSGKRQAETPARGDAGSSLIVRP